MLAASTQSKESGYSLIELIAVVAILGFLGSLGFSFVSSQFSDLDDDKIQTHLNQVAASCLRQTTPHEAGAPIDQTLIAKSQYELNPKAKDCDYLELTTKKNEKTTQLSLGFGIVDGKVFKHAQAYSDATKAQCDTWAGDRCATSPEQNYDRFYAHMRSISTAKLKIERSVSQKLNKANGEIKIWDSGADDDCPDTPQPNQSSGYKKNCKIGYTTTWAINGAIVGSEPNYNSVLSTQQQQQCDKAISSEISSRGASYSGPIQPAACKEQIWIHQTKIFERKQDWSVAKHEALKSECEQELAEKRTKIPDGGELLLKKAEAPLPCNQSFFVCKNVLYSSRTDANSACGIGGSSG